MIIYNNNIYNINNNNINFKNVENHNFNDNKIFFFIYLISRKI